MVRGLAMRLLEFACTLDNIDGSEVKMLLDGCVAVALADIVVEAVPVIQSVMDLQPPQS